MIWETLETGFFGKGAKLQFELQETTNKHVVQSYETVMKRYEITCLGFQMLVGNSLFCKLSGTTGREMHTKLQKQLHALRKRSKTYEITIRSVSSYNTVAKRLHEL